jgi:hypothetical protein
MAQKELAMSPATRCNSAPTWHVVPKEDQRMATENKRHELGEAALSAITGGTGAAVVESLKDIALTWRNGSSRSRMATSWGVPAWTSGHASSLPWRP